jgi:hypothetical protein
VRGQKRVNNVGTDGRVSVIYYKNLVGAAWKGAGDDGIWYATMDISDVNKDNNFGPQTKIDGVGTKVGPTMCLYKGVLYLFWTGSGDTNCWYTWWNDGAQEFEPQTKIVVPDNLAIGSTAGPTAVETPAGVLLLAWNGSTDNTLWWSFAHLG